MGQFLPTQNNTVANMLFDSLAHRPYCGNTKLASLIRKKVYAINFDYLVINLPMQTAWITFDLDHTNMMIWQDAGLPKPNFIVRDPQSGRGHITYAIESVCTSQLARSKPLQYLQAIRLTMSHLLKADPSYNNRITKNPFSTTWCTTWLHHHVYSLSELHEYLPHLITEHDTVHDEDDSDSSHRNCSLFNHIRRWAYQTVNTYRLHQTFDTWLQCVTQKACAWSKRLRCPIRGCLPFNEITSVARSIAKWCWHHYRKKNTMQLDPSLSQKERQQKGARYTHNSRRKKTEEKIRNAIDFLISESKEVTPTEVSRLSGVSRSSIHRYKHILEETSLKKEEFRKKSDVSYASYQVTAVGEEKVNAQTNTLNNTPTNTENTKTNDSNRNKTRTNPVTTQYHKDKKTSDLYKISVEKFQSLRRRIQKQHTDPQSNSST